jgi:methyl-accepting chemotaxis protein
VRIQIGTRVRLSLAAIVAIVLISGLLAFGAIYGLADEVRGSLTDAVESATALDGLRLDAREARLVIAASAAAATTTDLATADQAQRRYADRLAALSARKHAGIDTAGLERQMAEMMAVGKEFAQANAAQQWSKAAGLSPRFEKLAGDLGDRLAIVAAAQRAQVDFRLSAASRKLKTIALVFAAGIAGCLLLGGVLDLSLRRRLVTPLRALTAATTRIVEHGDLAQNVAIGSDDEIGDLARCFQQMVEKLRQITTSLREATDVLGSSVRNLGAAAAQQVQAVSRQAAAVQQTSATAAQIRQMSELAAQRASALLDAVARADDVGEAGESSVQRTLESLGDMALRAGSTAEQIELLKQRMAQIDAVNVTVKNLADQSNMLALNAAIEAVRSGEHGKGFAVVAREIRALADASIHATTQVREILHDIGRAIEETARTGDAARRRAEAGLSEAQSSGATLRQLSEMVKESASGVRQIAGTITQQDAGVGQIFAAVRDLTALMDDTRERVDSNERAIAEILDVATRVSTLVKSYRT